MVDLSSQQSVAAIARQGDSFETSESIDAYAEWGLASSLDYVLLLKPRVMSLSIFTALVGLVLAPVEIHWVIGLAAVLCISIGAGAAGALNMWYESELDGRMNRTSGRPLPQGRVSPDEALAFGIVLGLGSVMSMAVLVNYMAAALLAFTIIYYVVIYTMWLKPRTAQNIVIGGAAGAFPPVIGWMAATGTFSFEPWILFAVIFLWTPPHFWALALVRAKDYEKAGLPMMPNVAGPKSTRRQIFLYTLLLLASTTLPFIVGMASWIYAATAVALGAGFLWQVFRLMEAGSALDQTALTPPSKDATSTKEGLTKEDLAKQADFAAMSVFKFSLIYLFGLFLALFVEGVMV